MAFNVGEAVDEAMQLIRDLRSGKRKPPPWLALLGKRHESPLEQDFAHHVVKYLSDDVEVTPQVWADTAVGRFRMDFVLERHGRRVAIECDGREFHEEQRDRARDFAILAAGAADVIYRVRGQDAFWRTDDVLYLLSTLEGDLFSGKGAANLRRLASRRAKQFAVHGDNEVTVSYDWDEYDNGPEEDMPFDFRVWELKIAIRMPT
jgi:very-short-patch-repair endonuclease